MGTDSNNTNSLSMCFSQPGLVEHGLVGALG
jgi:hypothetical protein